MKLISSTINKLTIILSQSAAVHFFFSTSSLPVLISSEFFSARVPFDSVVHFCLSFYLLINLSASNLLLLFFALTSRKTTVFVTFPPSLPSLNCFSLLAIFHFYHTCPLLLQLRIIYTDGSTRLMSPMSRELVSCVRIVGEARHYICPPPNYSLKPTEDLWVVFSSLHCTVCVV